jgi:deazaflavin-dependent oxidoreductase (nitroreductase family)
MVLPRWLARSNRIFTNRVLGKLPAAWSPFVLAHHVGRRTGRPYTTPLMTFRTDSGFVFALTYGPGADWVRNVLSSGTFLMDRRGVRYALSRVRLIHRSEAQRYLPRPIRLVLKVLRVDWFLAADSR